MTHNFSQIRDEWLNGWSLCEAKEEARSANRGHGVLDSGPPVRCEALKEKHGKEADILKTFLVSRVKTPGESGDFAWLWGKWRTSFLLTRSGAFAGFLLLDPLLSQSRHFLVYQRATRMCLVHKEDEAKPARVEKLGNECIELRDIVTWFRWFRCGKCCLRTNSPSWCRTSTWFGRVLCRWDGLGSFQLKAIWVVSCGCATTCHYARSWFASSCLRTMCNGHSSLEFSRLSKKQKGTCHLRHSLQPCVWTIHQCRGESCWEPCG